MSVVPTDATTEQADLPKMVDTTPVAKPKKKKPAPIKKVVKSNKPLKHEPSVESAAGFVGRRPISDPYRVGETVVHEVTYLKMSAGSLTLQVKPFVEVNGQKSYFFKTSIKTSSLFSKFYAVDDYVDVLVNYEDLVPRVFTLHVRESGQIREAQQFFDVEKNFAKFWEKKVTEKDGKEERKLEWEIEAYAQNVYSAVQYMRVFQWDVGTENAYRVADMGDNLIFRGKAIRKEVLSTAIGDFKTVVIKPEVELRGKFRPVGDIFVWLSDDDRKYILRIEAEIKIGSLISEVVELKPGQ